MERARCARLRRDAAILQGAEAGKNIYFLITAADAQAGAPLGRQPGDVAAAINNAARSWRQVARKHVDECRLACAVGPDDRVHLSDAHFERNIVDGGQTAE